MLYATAATTGLRAKELRVIQKGWFSPDFSSVSLAGKFTKNKKAAQQPIPPTLREPLAAFCASLPADGVLWPMVEGDAIDILRADAKGTGIVIGRSADKGVCTDFHSFRHTFISNLERAGMSDTMKKRLSRATGGIVERYTHRDEEAVQAQAENLLVPDMRSLVVSIVVSGGS